MNTERIQLKSINQKGFTMIEALVVTSILVFGFVAANKVQVNMVKAKHATAQDEQAVQLSAQEIEQVRNFSTLSEFDSIANKTSTPSGAYTNYTDALAVTTQTRYKQLNQTLSWTDAYAQPQSISLSSYANRGDPRLSGIILGTIMNSTPLSAPNSGTTTTGTTDTSSPNTTSTYDVTVSGTDIVLTYDQNNNVTAINHGTAVTISGTVSLGVGGNAPPSTVTLAAVSVTPTSSNNIVNTCSYSGSTGAISCIMGSNWSGTIHLGGVTGVKVCAAINQPYSNVLTSLTGQNFRLIKTTGSCPSTHSFLIQTLN